MDDLKNKIMRDPVGREALRKAPRIKGDLPILIVLTDGSKHWFRRARSTNQDFDKYVLFDENSAELVDLSAEAQLEEELAALTKE
jgi:hypothetical protein